MKTEHIASIVAATLMGCLFNAPQLRATPAFTPGITETEGPTYTPTHYVDFAAPNDNGDGTQANPWKYAPGMPGSIRTAAPGNVIALKRGSVWRMTGTWNIGQSGTSGNPIVYTAYGTPTDPLPKYTVLERYNTGWTVHSGNVWKRTTGGTVERVFVNEEGMGEAASVATVGQANIVNGNSTGIIKYWKHDNGILYLYSPAGNPGAVSVVEGLQDGIGNVVMAENRSHIYMDRIAVYGGASNSVWFVTNGSYAGTNMRFTNGVIKCVKQKALLVTGASSSAFTNGVIKWNVIDACNGSSTRPVPDDATYGLGVEPFPGEGSGSHNGITLYRRIQGWVVAQNDVSNFWHTQIQLEPNHDGPVIASDNLIEHNEVHAENINYGHGIAIAAFEQYAALLEDNTSRYNYVHDIWNGDRGDGTNTRIYGNLYDGIYGTPRKSDSTWNGWAGDCFSLKGYGVSTGGVFAYNTIVNAAGPAVSLQKPASGLVIANNIFSHNGARRFGISLRDQYETNPRPDLDKNLIYSPDTTDIYQHEVHSTRITVAEMQAIESTWNNNIAADPEFTNYGAGDLTLGASSPARGVAKDISGALPESAEWTDLGCWQGAATTTTTYEAEGLTIAASSGDVASVVTNGSASDGEFRLYKSNAASDYITFTVNVPQSGTYDIKAIVPKNSYRGIFQMSVDGVNVGSTYDAYAAGGATFVPVTLATGVSLTAGNRAFKFAVTGKNASSSDYQIALDTITLELSVAQVPAAPSNLVATAISQTQINLSWADNSNNETGFKIERKTGAGSFAEIATAGVDATTYNNTTGLTAGTNYTYQVRATNATGDSTYSNTSSATTFAAVSTVEAESLTIAGSSGDITSIVSKPEASNGEFRLYKSNAASDYITFTVSVPQAGTYDIKAIVPKNSFRGVFQLSVDGVNVGSTYDGYAGTLTYVSSTLASGASLSSGNRAFKFTVTGKNASSSDYQIALDTITLEQVGP